MLQLRDLDRRRPLVGRRLWQIIIRHSVIQLVRRSAHILLICIVNIVFERWQFVIVAILAEQAQHGLAAARVIVLKYLIAAA